MGHNPTENLLHSKGDHKKKKKTCMENSMEVPYKTKYRTTI